MGQNNWHWAAKYPLPHFQTPVPSLFFTTKHLQILALGSPQWKKTATLITYRSAQNPVQSHMEHNLSLDITLSHMIKRGNDTLKEKKDENPNTENTDNLRQLPKLQDSIMTALKWWYWNIKHEIKNTQTKTADMWPSIHGKDTMGIKCMKASAYKRGKAYGIVAFF